MAIVKRNQGQAELEETFRLWLYDRDGLLILFVCMYKTRKARFALSPNLNTLAHSYIPFLNQSFKTLENTNSELSRKNVPIYCQFDKPRIPSFFLRILSD